MKKKKTAPIVVFELDKKVGKSNVIEYEMIYPTPLPNYVLEMLKDCNNG